MNYLPGEFVLVAFPFTSGGGTKTRPAMVVLDAGDRDLLLARVTTRPHQTQYDVLLSNWKSAGLLAASTVRLHKLATLETSLVRHKLGQLDATDRKSIAGVLNQFFSSW